MSLAPTASPGYLKMYLNFYQLSKSCIWPPQSYFNSLHLAVYRCSAPGDFLRRSTLSPFIVSINSAVIVFLRGDCGDKPQARLSNRVSFLLSPEPFPALRALGFVPEAVQPFRALSTVATQRSGCHCAPSLWRCVRPPDPRFTLCLPALSPCDPGLRLLTSERRTCPCRPL